MLSRSSVAASILRGVFSTRASIGFPSFFFFWLGQATRSEDVVGIDCGGQRRVLLEMSSF